MFRPYLIPMSLLVFGCSSSTTNEANTGGQAGMAGQAGAAGSNTGGANTGGVGNTGGSNIGGEAGNPSGGSGGGDSGVGGTGGGGGTGGVCVPKTCATFSYEKTGKTDLACGVIQDGCGNVVDCGINCKDPMHICGGAIPESDGGLTVGNPNFCGGGCIETSFLVCNFSSPTPTLFKCSSAVNVSPKQNCVPYGGAIPTDKWCCPK